MKKLFIILFALVLVLGFSLVPAIPAVAVGGVPDRATAITNTADKLVTLQNADGGFPWKLTEPPGTSATNCLGVTAMGILKAEEIETKTAYQAALAQAYKYVMDMPPAYTWVTDKYKETTAGVDSYPDITFLLKLANAANSDADLLTAIQVRVPDTTPEDIAALAKTRWDNRTLYLGSTQETDLNGTATGLAQYIRDMRHSQDYNALIPWDLELGVEAALALDNTYPGQGYDVQAVDIANVIYAAIDDGIYFGSTDTDQEDYIAGLTGAIKASAETGLHTAKAAELLTLLLDAQQAGGYWNYYGATPATMSVQSTAYAIMALFEEGSANTVSAANEAADWLVSNQNTDGGWYAENRAGFEYAETDSEAAWALARLPAPVTIGTKGYYSIQSAVNSASTGDTILVTAGTYHETLNLLDKGLTLDGAGVGATIVDTSFATGYAVQNFGNGATISDLTLIGTGAGSSSYGFKVSHVSDITFERVKVENSYKTAFDLNTVDTATLTDIEAVDTISGFGLMILDSTAVNVNNIATRGNAWGGVSVQTKNSPSNLVNFTGTFDVQEDVPLLIEQDPDPIDGTYHPITNVAIPSKFTHVVYALREDKNYKQFFYRPGQLEAKTFAQSLMDSTAFTYSNILIYDIAAENYYVIEGMLIQEAITAATLGATINVAAGTYDEQVVITKSLTLQGAGDTTIVQPSSAAKLTQVFDGLFWYGGTKNIAGIIVANVPDGSAVTVKNLKVDESAVTTKPTGADYLAGIFYRETGGLVDTVNVAGTGAWSSGDRAYGMYLSATTNTVTVEVTGSSISNWDKNGIEAHGSTLTANINHNTLTGRGVITDEVQNGVSVGRDAAATVNYNTISNLAYQSEQWWAAGILVYHYVSPTGKAATANNNTITNCQIGIIFKNANATAQGNTVSGGTVGLIGIYAEPNASGTWTASFVSNTVSGAKDDSYYGDENAAIGANTYDSVSTGASLTVTIDNNQLLGEGLTEDADGISIGVGGATGSVVANINNNTISGWQYGIHLDGANVNATASSAHLNNISHNSLYGIYNGGSGTLDATNNWWGNASGPQLPAASPNYRSYGDKVSNGVDYNPWLLAPVTAGFEPTTYDYTLALKDGWTLVSVDSEVAAGTIWVGTNPLAADDSPAMILAYKYTAGSGYTQVMADKLTSVDAYYVKTKGGGGIGINYSTAPPVVVTKELKAGWNLISTTMLMTDANALLGQLRYAQIGNEQGVGLTTLVGQGDYNQFTYSMFYPTITDADWLALCGLILCPYDGYWVHLNAPMTFGVVPD